MSRSSPLGRRTARRSSSRVAACRPSPEAHLHDPHDQPDDVHPGRLEGLLDVRVVVTCTGSCRSALSPSADASERPADDRRARAGSRAESWTRLPMRAPRRHRRFSSLTRRRRRVGRPHRRDPGVTPTSILLGGTVPLSGEAAAFGSVGPGAKAYFDYVNAKGGVFGRKITYSYYDDAYNPAQTVQLTRQLVEQDKVFAIFNSVGTANNLAIRDYLNAAEGAAALRRRRLRRARPRLREVPVDDGLPAELPRRGRRLRARHREARAEGEDRRAAREHRSRQGHDARALARDRGQGPDDRRVAAATSTRPPTSPRRSRS